MLSQRKTSFDPFWSCFQLEKTTGLPTSCHIWDLQSMLFDQPMADVAFRRLLHLTQPRPDEWTEWCSAIPQTPLLDSSNHRNVRPSLQLGSDPKSAVAKCALSAASASGDQSNFTILKELCSLRTAIQNQNKPNNCQKMGNDIE